MIALAELPAELAARIGAPRPPTERGAVLVDDDDPSAIARAVEWLRHSAPDHGTFAVACRVRDFGVSEPMCGDLMLEHWRDRLELGKSDEHVLFRVANAYRYGQNPAGVRSPEAEFEPVEVVDRRTKPQRAKLYFETWDEVDPRVEADESLLSGWYDRGAMIVTYGESNAGKSNVVLSQCVAIASGQPWGGCDVHRGLVVYVAAEGGRSLKKRIRAYQKRMGLRGLPIALVPCPVDLLRPAGDTKALIALVREAEARFGQPCVMVVIDTASRALAGGNENAPDDMGALVMHCDQIREATKAALHLIHHSGKNRAAGARGHSLLRAATDTEIEVGEGEIRSTKQRDMDAPKPMAFTYESVPIGSDSRGRPVTSIVTHVQVQTEFEAKMTDADVSRFRQIVALARRRCGLETGDEITEEMSRSPMSKRDFVTLFQRGSKSRLKEDTVRDWADALVLNGVLRKEKKGTQNQYFLIMQSERD